METWNSDVGEEIKETVGEESGFKLLGGTYRGPRIVTATKEMKNIEDFKGFKLRAPNLEMYLETWKWMKAAPTPIADDRNLYSFAAEDGRRAGKPYDGLPELCI